MSEFKEFLEGFGLAEHEVIVARIAHAVWASIDWNAPFWKTAGFAVYERFESRVRAAARESTLHGFASRLARKCHVAVPHFGGVLLDDMGVAAKDTQGALSFARKESGLVVAAIRAHNDERKAQRESGEGKRRKAPKVPLAGEQLAIDYFDAVDKLAEEKS